VACVSLFALKIIIMKFKEGHSEEGIRWWWFPRASLEGNVTRQCDGMAHAQYRTDSNEYLSREAGVGLIHVQQAFNDRLSVSAAPLPCLRLFSVVKAKILLWSVFLVLCEKAKLFSFMRLEKIRSLTQGILYQKHKT
jgi:hypothetical protein